MYSQYSRSQWPRDLRRRSGAARLLRSWVRIPPGARVFVVSVVCCQAEVSATTWSLVQSSPTDCCVVACDLETSRIGAPYIYDISSLRVNPDRSSTAGSTSGSLLGASVEVAVWRSFLLFLIFKRFTSQSVLWVWIRGKNLIEPCDESFVADAPVKCGVWPTSAAQFGPSPKGVLWFQKLNRPQFLGYYGELHHADVSLPLNKNWGAQFFPVYRSDAERLLRNSVRRLSDQASWFPKYNVTPSL